MKRLIQASLVDFAMDDDRASSPLNPAALPPGWGMLVIVDGSVEHLDILTAGVLDGATVAVLDPDRDGIQQITALLHESVGISSVHIVAHGTPGSLFLGNSSLGLEMGDRQVDALKSWSTRMAHRPLLLYGCEVASGPEGMAFIRRFQELTQAHIAASTRKVGSSRHGGTWHLDVQTHPMQAFPAFKAAVLDHYPAVLSAPLPPPGASSTTTTFTNSTPDLIPSTGTSGLITDTLLVSGLDPYLWDLDLTTLITHTFSADLDIVLISPTGTRVTITTDNGGGNDNVFNGTLWDDDGGTPVTDFAFTNLVVATPLEPEGSLGRLIGENPNGLWTIEVNDDAGADVGSLNEWSLRFTTLPAAPSTKRTSFVDPVPLAIADAGTLTKTLVVSGLDGFITDVNLLTSILHTVNSDLDIALISPEGTRVTISTDNGGSNADVFNGTLWDDAAAEVVTDVSFTSGVVAPTLTPEEALAAFMGENPNGVWTLEVVDDTAGNTGTLNQWQLDIETGRYPVVAVSASGSPSEDGPTSASFTITLDSPAPAGGLTLQTSFGGTAIAADFLLAAGTNVTAIATNSVTLAPGATSATLVVVPVNDSVIEPDETVQLAIAPGAGYVVGPTSSAQLTLTDNERNLVGTSGNDALTGLNGEDRIKGLGGNDRLRGQAGNDVINGGGGDDTLLGQGGNDNLKGGGGDDLLKGGGGDDLLNGGSQNDTLLGGAGIDRLIGGRGDNILRGGGGNDFFAVKTGQGRDRIIDFRLGSDQISLSGGLAFGDLSFTQGNNGAQIRVGNDLLAELQGIQASQLTTANFV